MRRHKTRPPVVALTLVACSGLVFAGMSPALADAGARSSENIAGGASTAKKAGQMLSAQAYGTDVSALGGIVDSDKTALVTFGCTQKVPLDRTSSVASVDLEPVGVVGAVATQVTSSKTSGVVTTQARTTIADASLLDGAIELEGLEVTATTTWSKADGYAASTETTAASLVISGEEIDLGEENLKITIPGIAKIMVNGVKTKTKKNRASASATALKITLLGGTGGKIVMGHASTGLDGRTYKGTFAGGGYGTTIELGGVVESGKTAKQSIPCLGTYGEDRSKDVAGVEVGPVDIGAIETTVNADAAVPEATTTAEVADVEISLGGLAGIALRGIRAVAHVHEDGGVVETSYEGSQVAELVVTTAVGVEVPIELPVEPNTDVDLLGLGTLHFLTVEELKGGRGISVTAATLDVPLLDLHLVLAHAQATIK